MFSVTHLVFLAFILCFSLSACSADMWAASSTAVPTPTPLNQPFIPPQTTTIKPIHASTGITAVEFLSHLPERPKDAMLLQLDSGVLTLLDAEGKSAGWTADFWSPASQQRYTFTLINGIILTQARQASPPNSALTIDTLNWKLKSLLDKATAAGGAAYLKRGYRTIAGLQPDGQNSSPPTWTIIYLPPDNPVPAFSVILDARNGQVLGTKSFSDAQ